MLVSLKYWVLILINQGVFVVDILHSKFGVADEPQAFDFTSHYFYKFFKRLNVLIRKNNLASFHLGKRDVVKDFQLKHVDNLTFKLPAAQ